MATSAKIAALSSAAVIIIGTLLGTAANATSAVNNGDFANIGSVFVDNTGYGSDDLHTGGATGIPGWTSEAGFANDFWTSPSNVYGLTASPKNGSGYFVDLTGQANDKPYGGIQQTISTVAGQAYTLSFDLGASTIYNSSGLGSAALTASVANATGYFTLDPTTTDDWISETLDFTATSRATTISFLADSTHTSQYTGLDNVAVNTAPMSAVPEPTTWGVMTLGFGLMGGIIRRRRGLGASIRFA